MKLIDVIFIVMNYWAILMNLLIGAETFNPIHLAVIPANFFAAMLVWSESLRRG